MSEQLLKSALKALRLWARAADIQLACVRLVVRSRSDALQLREVAPLDDQPAVDSASDTPEIVTSLGDIQMWETGTAHQALGWGGVLEDVRWEIDWMEDDDAE